MKKIEINISNDIISLFKKKIVEKKEIENIKKKFIGNGHYRI